VRHLKARRGDDADQAMRTTLRKQGEAVVAAFGESGLLVNRPS
jgi:hypothetical protein